jgi:hypothetical protein
MRPRQGASAALAVLSSFVAAATARAQGLPLLPPPAPVQAQPAAASPAQPPPAGSLPDQDGQPSSPGPAAPAVTRSPTMPPPLPPPPVVYIAPEAPPHAPPFSLWLGARLGLLVYAGGLYVNDQATGSEETTGNFVQPGLGVEIDVGARLAQRYTPYLALEYGFVGTGHRFEGSTASTSAHTSFIGGGFRYLSGNPDTISFSSEISFGVREFDVSSGSSTYSLSGIEIFRLGLGPEIRVNNLVTISPMLSFSWGAMHDTSGTVAFAPNQGDGQQSPPFSGSGNIPGWAQATYYAIFIGCGAYADLFGK